MKSKSRGSLAAVGVIVVIAACIAAAAWLRRDDPAPAPEAPPAAVSSAPPSAPSAVDAILAGYAGSASCRECHEAAFAAWQGSHHALAERDVGPEHLEAFDPPRVIRHGTQTSEARLEQGRPSIVTAGFHNERKPWAVERIFGVAPLWQALVRAPGPGGRLHATELAYDPARREWFDVYGEEDRQPGEWGHWTGRGMAWNTMCAGCHNTRLIKGYDAATDTYDTRRAEMGVGCEACHGPHAQHVAWQRERRANSTAPVVPGADPHVRRLAPDRILPMCGSCHARRTELTGDFVPGDLFLDHFTPSIPDETAIYHADGQVLEEDFEYVSFLGSRMRGEGVRCIDCHEPHSAKTRFPGNELCLQCHRGKIDPAAHSHHVPGEPGGRCVDCHMPLTTYMERHPRRDHGFTIPDPLLTRLYGIPNACNRCHTDTTVDWAVEATDRWYGARMQRRTRARAEAVAQSRAGDAGARERVLALVRDEAHPFWRAVLGGLLQLWPQDERARARLVTLARDEDALVRAMAARALGHAVATGDPDVRQALDRLLEDPVRSPRTQAAWALHAVVDPGSRAGVDLWSMMRLNADQPIGLAQMAQYHIDRGHVEAGAPLLRRATEWDPRSPDLRRAYAVTLSLTGDAIEAVAQMEAACDLAPTNADYRMLLGLAYNEAGRLADAIAAFERTVAIDPTLGRAWYNLAVARFQLEQGPAALEAVARGEEATPDDADLPYLRGSILFRMGHREDARRALEHALRLAPGHRGALELLELIAGVGR